MIQGEKGESHFLTLLAAMRGNGFEKKYVIINATVPTGSMERLFGACGWRISFQNRRGDNVIFSFPDDEHKNTSEKRVN